MTLDGFAARLERLRNLAILPDKPEETPETTLRALWHAASGAPLSAESAAETALTALSVDQLSTLDALIARRLEGIPLAHLTGRQRFLGIELLAGPEALVPRKETELLGRTALARVDGHAPPRIIDLCTGSGNLACALAVARPDARIVGADLSHAAVTLARRNAVFAGVAGRVSFHEGDLFAALPEAAKGADLLVCNPPYISTAKVEGMAAEIAGHEPRLAFDGGGFGLGIVSRLIAEAPAWLKEGGWLCFELGKGQGTFLQRSLAKAKSYDAIEPLADEAGEIRVLAARKGSLSHQSASAAVP